METKFTKGKWSIDPMNSLSIIDDSGDRFHQLICQTNGKGMEEAAANAKLIAAAPTMFEALCEIAEGKGRYDEDRLRHAANCIEDMVALAKEAIKKVTE
jgi:hypothetical protein